MKTLYIILLAMIATFTSFAQTKKVIKKTEEWKKILTKEQYAVLIDKECEAPFIGNLHSNFEKGTYHCAACNTPLFSSNAKYEANNGYPTFFDKIGNNVTIVKSKSNPKLFSEIYCSICNGFLGFMYNDGPMNKTKKRYHVNPSALKFNKAK